MNLIRKIYNKSKRFLKKALKKIYTLIFCDPYHHIKNRHKKPEKSQIHHVYDARELFFQENDAIGFNRYDMIVRLLAIENYYGKNDFGWELYRKQQNTRKGEDWQNAESRFRALIKSYEEKGYDENSRIQVGSDLRLWDGSHRMALAMYHKYYPISCQVMPTSRPIYYGINWYLENDFSLAEIAKMQERYELLKNEIQVPFICTLWAPVAPYFDEIIERLKLVCDVESYKDYSVDAFSYAQMARKIYAVDDIEKWKIEKKIEYMQQNVMDDKWVIRVVKLNLNQPRFRRKDSTQNTLSMSCEEIKRIIRNCYKDKLPNYFHDIICHIGDNFYQNEFIDKLFSFPKNLVSNVFEVLENYEYAIAKFNTPSIPMNFPQSYPIGKDVDIVCKGSNFNDILTEIENCIDKILPSVYTYRRALSSSARTQIRIELEGNLMYAFDVYYQVDNIDISFFEELLSNRVKYKGVFITAIPYEMVLRLYEIYNYPEKAHHLYFACTHINDISERLCDKYLTPETKDILQKIQVGQLSTSNIVPDKMRWGGGKVLIII